MRTAFVNIAIGRIGFRASALAFLAWAAVAVWLGACKDSTGPARVGPPAAVQVVSGDAQQGTVGQELPQPLVVKVVDANGNAVQGQVVNFRVTAGGGDVFAGSSNTNAQGMAQERWTLGTVAAAQQRLEVRAVDNNTGQPIVFGAFTATANPGAPDSAVMVAGDGQSGEVGAQLASQLEVRIADKYGNDVPAVVVAWNITLGGGTLGAATTPTDASGVARVAWTLGTIVGTNELKATAGALPPITFTAQAAAGSAATFTLVSGGGQTADIGSFLPRPIVVKATDRHGNPAVVTVTFTAPGNGIFFPPTVGTSGPQGEASSTWRLDYVAGTQTATVTAPGLNTLTVSAIGTPLPASQVIVVSGDQQIGVASQTLPQPLVVRVTDTFGNASANIIVSFAASSGCGSVAPSSASTDGAGLAQTQWTLGASGAACTGGVSASLSTGARVNFTALVTGSSAASISAGNYTDLVGSIGAPTQLFAFLKDAAGNGVPGLTVTWTLTSGTGSFSVPSSVTDTLGVVNVAFTPGTVAGNNTVSATVSGVGSANYLVWTKANSAVRIVRLGGDGQTGPIGQALAGPISVRVEDQYGNGVYLEPVQFAVTSGNGHVERMTLTTDTLGVAITRWIPGALGTNTASATWNGASVFFSATAIAHTADGVLIVSGNEQVVAATTLLNSVNVPQPLVVKVIDGQGNPVAGAQVNWTWGFGSTTSATDTAGQTSATVYVSPYSSGTRTIFARLSNGSVANFTVLVQGTCGPVSCSLWSGGGQSARVGTRLPNPVIVACFGRSGPGGGASVYTTDATHIGFGGALLPVPGYRAPGYSAYYWVMPSQPGTYYLFMGPNSTTATATP